MAYDVGVQSYTYRELSIDEICDALVDTPISAIELYSGHVGPGDDIDAVESVVDRFDAVGIDICGWSAPSAENPDAIDAAFERIDVVDPAYLSVGSQIENPEVATALIERAEERELLLAVHNHGPDPWSDYGPVEEVLEVVADYPRTLGAAVDTGHYLRSGQEPAHVIPALGDRVHAVHLKDYTNEGDEVSEAEANEVVPGDGRIDLAELLDLLEAHTAFDQPLVVEYELDPEDPTPAVVETANRLAALMD